MRTAIRAVIALVGLFNLVLALGFFVDPARLGAEFFLAAVNIQGLATMRADMTAFFVTGASFALLGAWRGQAAPLLVPLCLLSVALFGRAVSLAVDGVLPSAFAPMIGEAIMIAILLTGYRVLDKPR